MLHFILSIEYTAAGLPIPVIDGVSLLNADISFGQVSSLFMMFSKTTGLFFPNST